MNQDSGQQNVVAQVVTPIKTTFLWLWGHGNSNDIQRWRGFSNRARDLCNSQNRYKAESGEVTMISTLRQAIVNSYVSFALQTLHKIDHVVIMGHGFGKRTLGLFDEIISDEGISFLTGASAILGNIGQNDDPTFIGASTTHQEIFQNNRYRELVQTMRNLHVRHFHLHTCYTGRGVTLLRQLAMDSSAKVYAYKDYVNIGWYREKAGGPIIWYQQVQVSESQDYPLPVAVDGVFQNSQGQFRRVTLRVTSNTNTGTMELPGWQVRAKPNGEVDDFDREYGVVETYDRNGNRIRSTPSIQ